MKKELKIEIPEGYEIDEERSTFTNIVFKEIETLPKTWEEFCKNYPMKEGECFMDGSSYINSVKYESCRHPDFDRNVLPNEETAKAVLAICQLIQLRDCYNDGWNPDWSNQREEKAVIEIFANEIHQETYVSYHHILVFKTRELCDMFLNNFRDLIEIAKPLL